jgi:hypothetical protein
MFLYWNVEEVLNAGTYRVDIFADNQLIGVHQFKLENNEITQRKMYHRQANGRSKVVVESQRHET